MFYTIYWVCIQGLCDRSYTSVFKYYFSNTWTGLDCSGVSLCSLGIEIELSSYSNDIERMNPLVRFSSMNSFNASCSNLDKE